MLHHKLETISRTKNQSDSIQYYFTKIHPKKPASEDETIYASVQKLISHHTKDGKTSFDSADRANG